MTWQRLSPSNCAIVAGQVIANLQHVMDEINGRHKEHELFSGFKKFPVSKK